jgi:Amt family ammonium transporter
MAERTKFTGYLIYSIVISALIYPVVGHWIWHSDGWLCQLGMHDLAGSTVVHSVGGWAAFAGAIVLGPRTGKYVTNGKKKVCRAVPGHSIPLAALGVFILWFGWFGFNAGSTSDLTALNIATICVTTNLAAAAGTAAAMLTAWARFGKPDTSMTLNGALGGLVAITAGCEVVSPLSAIVIGLAAGVLVVLAVEFFDKVVHVDDPVGAVSVHGVCGVFGTLCVGLFANTPEVRGLFYGGGLGQLGIQALGAASVFLWVGGAAFGLFFLLQRTVGLRVSREEELRGLDIGEHGMEAYSGFQVFTTQ